MAGDKGVEATRLEPSVPDKVSTASWVLLARFRSPVRVPYRYLNAGPSIECLCFNPKTGVFSSEILKEVD